jgi:hypothetical protein
MKNKCILSVLGLLLFSALYSQQGGDPDIYGSKYAGESNDAKRNQQGVSIQELDIQKTATSVLLLDEGFDNLAALSGAGWIFVNNSVPPGSTSWFQGNANTFASYDGAPDAYIAANYNNTNGTGTISNWLISPVISIKNGDILSFWTRTTTVTSPDRLEVRASISGSTSTVGNTANSTGDFGLLLLSVNPSLTINQYPSVWTRYEVVIDGLTGYKSGRIAFRYYVTEGGSNGQNSDYIGIDRIQYASEPTAVPLSSWTILLGISLMGGFFLFFSRIIA